MMEIGGNRLKFGIEYEITKVKYRFYDGNRGKSFENRLRIRNNKS